MGRLSAAVNRVIKTLQDRVNEHLNDSIQDAVYAVFGKAFKEVKEQADSFFPKFKHSLEKLKECQDAAEKANQMAGSAQRGLDAIKSFGKRVVDRVTVTASVFCHHKCH